MGTEISNPVLYLFATNISYVHLNRSSWTNDSLLVNDGPDSPFDSPWNSDLV